MEESWKDIEGFEGLYQVSNYGNVKSLNYRRHGYEKNLTPKENNDGRLWVELANNGKTKCFLIHRLVANAFIPNPNGFLEINHKDENPKNNAACNLEWCSRQYNVDYYYQRHPHGPKRRSTERYGMRKHLKVAQFKKDGTFVKRWNNSREIFLETGMSDWGISECCRGNRKSAHGYIWRYASENISTREGAI